jgi:hypothetical protein
MIEYKPIGRHTRWNHEPTRLCDGQPSDDYDILIGDMESLCEARAEATLCPTCRQNSNLHTFSFRPNRYRTGKRTAAHLYTIPVQYAFAAEREAQTRSAPGSGPTGHVPPGPQP